MSRSEWQPIPEMLWTPDASYEAAKRLPEWVAFHRLCGKHGLCFDFPEKDGRAYRLVAFTPEKTAQGGWRAVRLATGQGRTILEAMAAAYRDCGRSVPGAAEMLERGLAGAPVAAADDEFAALLPEPEDEFEGLL